MDGGYRMAAPPGMTRQTLPLVMADRVGRLGRRWSGVDEYLEYFTGSTAPLLDRADPLLRNYLEHDLADGRVRLSGEALIDDAVALFFDELAWDRVEVPIRYATAEWSAGADTPPAYPPESVERIRDKALRVVEVKGVDHASLIMTRRGAQVAADLVRRPSGDSGRSGRRGRCCRRSTLVELLGRRIPADRLVLDPDVLASLSADEAEWAPAGRPLLGAARPRPRPTSRTPCAACAELRRPGRAPRRRHRPVRRRERGRRLPHPRPVQDEPRSSRSTRTT